MTEATARLALPMLVPGQAQKEMSHNEALAVLDAAVQASVVALGVETPPVGPVVGQCWITGEVPTGAWTGHSDELAVWTEGGWRFIVPTPGFRVWAAEDGLDAQFLDGEWVLGRIAAERLIIAGEDMLSTPADPIADPTGGAMIDSQARAAIASILAALRHHNLLETA